MPLPLATVVGSIARVHHWTEKFRLSINVCLYGKNQPFFRVFLIPDFKIRNLCTDVADFTTYTIERGNSIAVGW
jgi:hypothetical protein